MPPTTDHEPKTADRWGVPPIHVKLNEPFAELVALNPELRIEQTASGEVVLMSPTGGESGYRNALINSQLGAWCIAHGGWLFDSSTLFQLPNGAKRSPDASWIGEARWQGLTAEQRKGYPPLCPDFVVELRSESDRLGDLQEKMSEYLANGAQLGWLIDPLGKQVHVYQPGREPEILAFPESLCGDPLLPGFSLDLSRIWGEA